MSPAGRVLAYVYPGWHPIPERDASFYPGFTEWDLVDASRPRFEGHHQPRLPAWGRYDDRDPVAIARRVDLAAAHGVDGLVYGFFWCRGKRVFQDALDLGFLGANTRFPFALMWANRMPRRVLPVPPEAPTITDDRLVPSDVDDFVALIAYLAERYFVRDDYIRVDGRAYFSIFDSTFFLKELGRDHARTAIARAREMLAARGFPPMHLAAIEPNADWLPHVREVGFDSVTNYVFLPDWKGAFLQDYRERAAIRAAQWPGIARVAGLPYHPSISPGWDASPRGADFGGDIATTAEPSPGSGPRPPPPAGSARSRPDKYPWHPVVVGEHPDHFAAALVQALEYSPDLTFIASLNEWSEGHYLEPDTRYGTGWIEAVQRARRAR